MTTAELALYAELLTSLEEGGSIRDWVLADYGMGMVEYVITLNNGETFSLFGASDVHIFTVGLSIGRGIR